MLNIKGIAKGFASGGKVSVSDARQLASDYLHKLLKIEELERKVIELQGGQTVELSTHPNKDFDKDDFYLHGFTRANGRSGAFEQRLLSELGDLLSFGIEKYHPGEYMYSLKGPIEHVRRFLRVNHIITALLQAAYNEGHEDGRNLLIGLADGTLSVQQFNQLEKNEPRERRI